MQAAWPCTGSLPKLNEENSLGRVIDISVFEKHNDTVIVCPGERPDYLRRAFRAIDDSRHYKQSWKGGRLSALITRPSGSINMGHKSGSVCCATNRPNDAKDLWCHLIDPERQHHACYMICSSGKSWHIVRVDN